MKKIIIISFILLLTKLSYAEVYVAIDRETGECKGTVDVRPENIGEWNKDYTMKLADESYRGLKGEEVKIVNGKLKKATDKEISDYKKEQADKDKIERKKKALEDLDITQAELDKLKG